MLRLPLPTPRNLILYAGGSRGSEAMSSRIIPTMKRRERKKPASFYFIDRALVTFASDSQKTYREGLADVNALLGEKFPGAKKLQRHRLNSRMPSSKRSAFKTERILRASKPPNANGQPFFDTLRYHTIAGFLIAPDSDRRGNRDGVGWKVIARMPQAVFSRCDEVPRRKFGTAPWGASFLLPPLTGCQPGNLCQTQAAETRASGSPADNFPADAVTIATAIGVGCDEKTGDGVITEVSKNGWPFALGRFRRAEDAFGFELLSASRTASCCSGDAAANFFAPGNFSPRSAFTPPSLRDTSSANRTRKSPVRGQ